MSLSNIIYKVKPPSAISFRNRWRNYGHGYRAAGVSTMHDGKVCVVGGLFRSGRRWNDIAMLPSKCKPDKRLIFSANDHYYVSRIDVESSGKIGNHGGGRYYGWNNFDGIVFTVKGGSRIKLKGDWKNYEKGYRHARYSRVGNPHLNIGGRHMVSHWVSGGWFYA